MDEAGKSVMNLLLHGGYNMRMAIRTCDSQEEAGKPLSLANDQSWRLDVATSLKQQEQRRITTIDAITVAAALLCVTS